MDDNLSKKIDEGKMRHIVNIFFGKEDKRTSFVVQQGEFNSREIEARLWEYTWEGKSIPLTLDAAKVMVVYKYGAITTPEYETESLGANCVCFTLPSCALVAPGMVQMQFFLYGNNSLLQSAVVPFKVLGSLTPSSLPKDDDVQPGTLTILKEAREVLQEAATAETERKAAERVRSETFAKWEKIMSELSGSTICFVENKKDLPAVGDEMTIYLARAEKQFFQWNEEKSEYEQLSGAESTFEITIIDGGNATGI